LDETQVRNGSVSCAEFPAEQICPIIAVSFDCVSCHMPFRNQSGLRKTNLKAFIPLLSPCYQIYVAVPVKMQGSLGSCTIPNKAQDILFPVFQRPHSPSIPPACIDKAKRRENKNTHIKPHCSFFCFPWEEKE
jgi:hypothetical protein